MANNNHLTIRPIHEKSHGRKKGSGTTLAIDFCFRGWNQHSYFGAECKLLEEKNNRLYDNFLEQGVCRYLSGKYSSNCSHGSLIGYIRIESAPEIINEVQLRVNKLPNGSLMQQAGFIDWFTEHYTSVHKKKIGISPFHVHHSSLSREEYQLTR